MKALRLFLYALIIITISSEAKVLTGLVLPIANGYNYGVVYGANFVPIIERELNKFKEIRIKSFPYRGLKNIPYHGIFDKKYCPPIFKKTKVDFLILSSFVGGALRKDKQNKVVWGYKIRIVSAKTLKHINSINAKNLTTYKELEEHLKKNIINLKNDILIKR